MVTLDKPVFALPGFAAVIPTCWSQDKKSLPECLEQTKRLALSNERKVNPGFWPRNPS